MADRKQTIETMLERDGIVYISELVKLFPDVSAMTIRRDLDFLERKGAALRIYGGAQKKTYGSEPYYSFRANKNREAKARIAALGVKLIGEGATVFIDCGTTAMELAKVLPNMPLFVITNAPNIAIELSKRESISVMVLGGQLNRDNYSISGRPAEEMLKSLNIDIAFIASSGLSLKSGFSCGNYNEKEMKAAVLGKARKRLILMDGAKIDKNMMFTFAHFSDIDALITDKPLPVELAEAAGAAGVEILS
ncbi:MAG: DeoR/GlpR family DNA-binding transcription regulator [Clostridiales bacterium]|nr:DeoR/GlpR family DNA-binding transcription regulator [Clostridiales bacterium]